MAAEMAQPAEAGRGLVDPLGIVGHRAPVFGLEPVFGARGTIVGHMGVVGVGKALGMNEGKVRDIEEPLDLAPGIAMDVDPRADDLLEPGLVPMGHVHDRARSRLSIFRIKAGPHEAIAFDRRIGRQMELRGDRPLGLGRNMDTAPARAEGQPVIRAFDPLAIGPPHAERHPAMGATVGRHDNRAIIPPIDHQRLIEQHGLERCFAHLAHQCDRIPVPGQDRPVLRIERATIGERGARRGAGERGRSHNQYLVCFKPSRRR